MHVPAIILAAGASRRLGQPKQLLQYQGMTLLQRMVLRAKAAGCRQIVVVTGAHADQVEAAIAGEVGVEAVRNEGWQDGQGASVAIGIRHILEHAPESAGVLVMLCDQPFVTTEHLAGLIDGVASGAGRVVATHYPEGSGVPACFAASCFGSLRALSGTTGAKHWIRGLTNGVASVVPEWNAVDLDAPEDLHWLDDAAPRREL